MEATWWCRKAGTSGIGWTARTAARCCSGWRLKPAGGCSMGKLVTIVGSSGSGKTTLARVICRSKGFAPFLEDLKIRPFQASFMGELKTYALPNQVDFLLYRAEQELFIRQNDVIGIQDGGLDLD